MKIYHKVKNIGGNNIIYIYVSVEDIYEFGKENLGKGDNTDFLLGLRKYINENLKDMKKTSAIIVINGVVVGSLVLGALYSKEKNINNDITNTLNNSAQVEVYKENIIDSKSEVIIKEETNEEIKNTETDKKEENINKVTNQSKTESVDKANNVTTKKEPAKTNTSNLSTTTTKTNNAATNKLESTTKPTTTTESSKENLPESSGITIKFNNGGTVSNIDLEKYVLGVVAAEMPASFHKEALKAQAVAARTYAMNRSSSGITLINSTAHQVYNSTSQMKAKWGASYTTYYNKIKEAVEATKGQVLKYGGQYIEASYFSMSNGKTELPSYVWSKDFPYLQVVSSPWDENISSATYNVSISYEKLSSKLGITVDENTEINILSRTAGDRVNEVSIGGKVFSGVKLRSLLGLRSADFSIKKLQNGVAITTKGYGHGVGMSQYGANGAAKSGMTYKQILKHYYPGTSIVSI